MHNEKSSQQCDTILCENVNLKIIIMSSGRCSKHSALLQKQSNLTTAPLCTLSPVTALSADVHKNEFDLFAYNALQTLAQQNCVI